MVCGPTCHPNTLAGFTVRVKQQGLLSMNGEGELEHSLNQLERGIANRVS